MTSPSERDLRRDLENLKERTEADTPTGVFKTKDGRYYDVHGNQIDDISEVCFIVPPEIWQQWDPIEPFTPPPE